MAVFTANRRRGVPTVAPAEGSPRRRSPPVPQSPVDFRCLQEAITCVLRDHVEHFFLG